MNKQTESYLFLPLHQSRKYRLTQFVPESCENQIPGVILVRDSRELGKVPSIRCLANAQGLIKSLFVICETNIELVIDISEESCR